MAMLLKAMHPGTALNSVKDNKGCEEVGVSWNSTNFKIIPNVKLFYKKKKLLCIL